MKFTKNNSGGFSLVSVIVAMGLAGGLALLVAKIMDNMSQGQVFMQNMQSDIDLQREVKNILDNEKYCRISFAGEGKPMEPDSPVRFEKADVDADTGGMDVTLWFSNQDGTKRAKKKFDPSDPVASQFNRLRIKSIKLIFNNGNLSKYAESPFHTDIAELKMTIEKPVSRTKYSKYTRRFFVNIAMKTNSSGKTTLLSCSRNGAESWEKVNLTNDDFFKVDCLYRKKDSPSSGYTLASTVNQSYLLFGASLRQYSFGRINYDDKSQMYHGDAGASGCNSALCATYQTKILERKCFD